MKRKIEEEENKNYNQRVNTNLTEKRRLKLIDVDEFNKNNNFNELLKIAIENKGFTIPSDCSFCVTIKKNS